MGDRLAGIKIPDVLKFGLMMLVYTFYMTWWAAKIDAKSEFTAEVMNSHIAADALVSETVIHNADTIIAMSRVQEQQALILSKMQKDHVACREILAAMNEKLNSGKSRADADIKTIQRDFHNHLRNHPWAN